MTSSLLCKSRLSGKKKGVLMPLFSLPSKYGIGCISREAFEFADWLAATGHEYWQVLPLNPTGNADSPYQPLSSFAGNAYFIDPETLVEQGLLTEAEAAAGAGAAGAAEVGVTEAAVAEGEVDAGRVDYGGLYDSRMGMLRTAYTRFAGTGDAAGADGTPVGAGYGSKEFREFCDENEEWLEDYGMFMALRERFGRELSWDEWPEPLQRREAWALDEARAECAETIDFYKWTQFEFCRQWAALKEYANNAGVKIIGDMPIYVSYDSADCWANPGQFQLDGDLRPLLVAGVPPDAFAAEGQLWGNPLYDWDKMRADGYRWWTARMRQSFRVYDVIRLDHFRGFESYYAVPADADDAICGEWIKGPGMELFETLAEVVGAADGLRGRFIAEDLGFLTEDVRLLLRESGFPGTKVLQFGFDGDPGNIYLPENYPENCVVYTGTHDNDTTVGWFEGLEDWEREPVLRYLGIERPHDGIDGQSNESEARLSDEVCDALIEKALTSRADLCIIPLQDYLHLGSEARTNIPGTVGGNWCWRLTKMI
ncbi:MAG: 4-alpha-glucanotransferase [Bacillota bacterium]